MRLPIAVHVYSRTVASLSSDLKFPTHLTVDEGTVTDA
jgi:hypothetical protein